MLLLSFGTLTHSPSETRCVCVCVWKSLVISHGIQADSRVRCRQLSMTSWQSATATFCKLFFHFPQPLPILQPLSFILHATATCLSSVFAQLEVLCAKNLFALLCVNFQASQCLQISINMIKFFILKNLKKYFWYEVLFNFQFARITIQNWNRKLIMAYIPYSSHSSHGFVSYSVICLDFVVECKWINPLDAHVCHTRDSTSMFCAHFPHGMFHFAIFSFSLCLCVLSVCACVNVARSFVYFHISTELVFYNLCAFFIKYLC